MNRHKGPLNGREKDLSQAGWPNDAVSRIFADGETVKKKNRGLFQGTLHFTWSYGKWEQVNGTLFGHYIHAWKIFMESFELRK